MSDERSPVVEYICKRFAQEDFLLNNIISKQEEDGGPMMHIGPDQGKFIYLLIKLLKPKNILEVGSYYGYSTVWLARAVRELNSEAGGSGQHMLHCIEISSKNIEIIREHLFQAELEQYVEIHEGSGVDIMNEFLDGARALGDRLKSVPHQASLDMIFIDADKTNYPNYLDLAARLLPSGGLLLVDNCIWGGEVLKDPSALKDDKQTLAIQAFNDKLAASKDFESVILTVQDGLAFAVKK